MVVAVRGRRLFELVEGRTVQKLEESLAHIEGAQNVELVALDMSDTYKAFARRTFPNARLVADKFHVLRLLNTALTQRRIEVTGDRRSMAIRRLLLRNRHALDFWNKLEVDRFLQNYPALREVTSRRKRSTASTERAASTVPRAPWTPSSPVLQRASCPSYRPFGEPSSAGVPRSSPTSTPD